MQFGINLLAKGKKKDFVEKEIIGKVRKIIGVALVGYALLILGLVATLSFLSLEKKRLSTQVSQLEATIKSYQKVESLEVLIKTRVSLAQKIIEPRVPTEAILVKIINSLEEGIEVSSLDFGKKDEISISAHSENVGSLESFLVKIKQIFQEEKYTILRLDGVNRDEDGGYSFSLLAKK